MCAKVSAAQGTGCLSESARRAVLGTLLDPDVSGVHRQLQFSLGRTISLCPKHFHALCHLVVMSSLEAGHLKPSGFYSHGQLAEKSVEISVQLLVLGYERTREHRMGTQVAQGLCQSCSLAQAFIRHHTEGRALCTWF